MHFSFRLVSAVVIFLLVMNAWVTWAATPRLGTTKGDSAEAGGGSDVARCFGINTEDVVRRQDIVYLQPPLRNGDYLALGNGDLGMQVDATGSQAMGGWINKTDIWLQMHTHDDNPLAGYGTLDEWQEARRKGGGAMKALLSREEAENDHYPSQHVRPRVGGRVASVLLVDGKPLQDVSATELKEKVTDYEQRLNLFDAVCETSFTWPGRSRTKARTFVHSGKNVALMRFHDRAEPGKQVSRRINLQRYLWEKGKYNRGWEGREKFHIRGDQDNQALVIEYSNVSGLSYTMACGVVGSDVRLVIEKGTATDKPSFRWYPWHGSPTDNYPMVEGNASFEAGPADQLDLTVLVTLVTNQESDDPTAAALTLLKQAQQEDIVDMESEHQSWWHRFWPKSFVEVADADMETYWFAQSYYLASSSRGRTSPPICNLWHQFADWPWQGGYWDFNTPAMYMTIQSTNHPELGNPFWQMIQRAIPGFRANAKQLYGARGFFMPASYGPEGYEIAPAYWRFRYFNTALTGTLQYWRYLYSLDRELLAQEVYPFLKEACLFYEDFLQWDEDNNRFSLPVPSCSLNETGSEKAWKIRNDAMDLAVIRRLFLSASDASKRLGVDSKARHRWREFLDKLAPIPSNGKRFTINESGAMEGLVHTNLTTIFPTDVVDRQDPRTLSTVLAQDKLKMGGQCFTGQMWAASAAWLAQPQVLTKAFHRWSARHLFPNAMVGEHTIEKIPQYDRSYAFILINDSGPWAQAAITEGLCQSLYDGVIRVFAAPPETADGKSGAARFAGLGAVNGFLVSSERVIGSDGQPHVSFVGIQSLAGADCQLAVPNWKEFTVNRVDSQTGTSIELVPAALQDNLVKFATAPGQTYILYPDAPPPPRLWSSYWSSRKPRQRKYVGLPVVQTP